MNKSTAIKLTNEMLTPYFENEGWKYKKGKWNCFYKEFNGGYKKFIMNYYDYNPLQRPDFLMVIVHNKVEEMYEKIIKNEIGFNEFECISIKPEAVRTIATGLSMILTTEINSAPPVVIEENLPKTVEYIINHIEGYGEMIFNTFEDVREIDKIINGDSFWEDDWKKPFNLGGGFAEKRLIIAMLCNNSKYKLFLKNYLEVEKSDINTYKSIENRGGLFYWEMVDKILSQFAPCPR